MTQLAISFHLNNLRRIQDAYTCPDPFDTGHWADGGFEKCAIMWTVETCFIYLALKK